MFFLIFWADPTPWCEQKEKLCSACFFNQFTFLTWTSMFFSYILSLLVFYGRRMCTQWPRESQLDLVLLGWGQKVGLLTPRNWGQKVGLLTQGLVGSKGPSTSKEDLSGQRDLRHQRRYRRVKGFVWTRDRRHQRRSLIDPRTCLDEGSSTSNVFDVGTKGPVNIKSRIKRLVTRPVNGSGWSERKGSFDWSNSGDQWDGPFFFGSSTRVTNGVLRSFFRVFNSGDQWGGPFFFGSWEKKGGYKTVKQTLVDLTPYPEFQLIDIQLFWLVTQPPDQPTDFAFFPWPLFFDSR